MAEIGNVTVRVDAVITDEQYHEAMGAVKAANERMDLLEAENAKLQEELAKWERLAAGIDLHEYPVMQFKPKDLERENVKLREQLDVAEHNQTRNAREYARLCHENAKLREQMERLVTLLRNDCDIEVSWDGLRRFWSIELTEDGCLMRDRACKAEAENAKLREVASIVAYCMQAERDCDGCRMNGAAGTVTEPAGCDGLLDLLRELGVI